jgi:hypothetical protein
MTQHKQNSVRSSTGSFPHPERSCGCRRLRRQGDDSAAEDSGSYNNAVLRRARFNHFLKEAGSKRPQGYQEVL